MSGATKRTSDASLSASTKKLKLDDGLALLFQKIDDEVSIGVSVPRGPPILPTVSFEGERGRSFASLKQHGPDDEGGPAPASAASASANRTAAYPNEQMPKKPTILTFSSNNDKFARLQLLSTHTLYDLVSTVCRHTPVGYDGTDGPDDHLWYVTHNGNEYESTDVECQSPLRANRTRLSELGLQKGSVLKLTYDYGSTSTYQIALVETQQLLDDGDDVLASFPRKQPSSGVPASFQMYQPNNNAHPPSNLDAMFRHLNDWIFHSNSANVSVNLFQAGRKKNYGFLDNKFTTMYLPTKPDTLADWLECFNRGACLRPAGLAEEGYTYYTWQSVVTLPRSRLTPQLRNKYKSNERPGFCDAPIVEDHAYYSSNTYAGMQLEKSYPKIAALAGLRKDKRVPKGWISFVRRGNECTTLAVCRGNAREAKKSKAPKGLAFEGEDQHEPVEEPLFEIDGGVEVRGLQDLFGVVEGLLRTL